MKKIIAFLLATAFILSFNACYYDKEDLLYGVSTCDTVSVVSYSQRIVPVLQQQCYSCHSGSSASGGIQMGTHATDKAIADNGKLLGSINHASGYSPMPQGAPKMSSCDIAIIKKWIDAGAPSN